MITMKKMRNMYRGLGGRGGFRAWVRLQGISPGDASPKLRAILSKRVA